MVKGVLGGVREEGDLEDLLALLRECFDDLNDMTITLPGHQG